jgi:putative DNA methylase
VTTYPKRLIEVDLPIKRISVHAQQEKKTRHGHISTLHIWWARRPLAACRAVICAALWPDPADPLCPADFRDKACAEMLSWTSHERQQLLSKESCEGFEAARQNPAFFKDPARLRSALLDFIADFANWDNSTIRQYLDTSRSLTEAAHEALGGTPGMKPLVVDPFAGGGALPIEALRVGADAFASDLNPVAVMLNKVALEFIPKYGAVLSVQVEKWGDWLLREANCELAKFYPRDKDGAVPIAYLWARTVQCEGPNCGAEIPLVRSLWLSKKGNSKCALNLLVETKARRIDFEILRDYQEKEVRQGTIKKGAATCPLCGFTTANVRVRQQLAQKLGGADTARLVCLVLEKEGVPGRIYRLPNDSDTKAVQSAAVAAEACQKFNSNGFALSAFPDEPIPKERPSPNARGLSAVTRIGINTFGDLFSARQKLCLHFFARAVHKAAERITQETGDPQLAVATATCLSIVFSKMAGLCSTFNRWEPNVQCVQDVFGRQAVGLVWDFAESNPLGGSRGSFRTFLNGAVKLLALDFGVSNYTTPEQADACVHPLPNDSAECIATDPPYFDSVPYADLSDYFFVWLKRALFPFFPEWRTSGTTPKDAEAIWNPGRVTSAGIRKDEAFYQSQLQRAFAEARRILKPSGIGTVVFAHKSTAGWEAVLNALLKAGWIVTASWPIDTELGTRVNAQGTASLGSSVHLVCRPREYPDGSVRTDEVGDWRDVLQELPRRIHEWMPRLAEEGVVGADAIFACLGPALEIFSRYSRVEKANGEAVTLEEYLEQVWAAVAKEALTMVFQGADASGFEPDARLTAMWLWTLQGNDADEPDGGSAEEDEADGEPEVGAKKSKIGGFVLEYDAARKIAQGLGANLEVLGSLVEISGEQARLLSVSERARHLFGKDEGRVTSQHKKREPQMDLFKVLDQADGEGMSFGETKVERQGETVLDRIHQSMILFAAGRGEALKRFLVEDGAGRDQRFWRLAQALSALYPPHIEEKRWIDGVLARKKGLGF